MAAWVREKEKAPETRQKKKGEVKVGPGVNVGSV